MSQLGGPAVPLTRFPRIVVRRRPGIRRIRATMRRHPEVMIRRASALLRLIVFGRIVEFRIAARQLVAFHLHYDTPPRTISQSVVAASLECGVIQGRRIGYGAFHRHHRRRDVGSARTQEHGGDAWSITHS